MSIRTDRVSRLIQREVATLLQGPFYEASHAMVTVTGARVTPDFATAYVYVSVLGSPEIKKATIQRLKETSPEIRKALAGRIRHQMRIIPDIRFFLDESLEHARKIESLFAQIRSERGDDDGSESSSPSDVEGPATGGDENRGASERGGTE